MMAVFSRSTLFISYSSHNSSLRQPNPVRTPGPFLTMCNWTSLRSEDVLYLLYGVHNLSHRVTNHHCHEPHKAKQPIHRRATYVFASITQPAALGHHVGHVMASKALVGCPVGSDPAFSACQNPAYMARSVLRRTRGGI